MKKGIKVFLLVLSVCVVSTALAKKPECDWPKNPPGKGNKPTKVTILHCGCADDGDQMHYVEINVSSKSKGHGKHVAGSIGSCSDGLGSYKDVVRIGSDCQVDDGAEPMDSMEFCVNQAVMDTCGMASTDS